MSLQRTAFLLIPFLLVGCARNDSSRVLNETQDSPCQLVPYMVGVTGALRLKRSAMSESKFGIRTEFFHGGWNGEADFSNGSAKNDVSIVVSSISSHIAHCYTDSVVGRVLPQTYEFNADDPSGLHSVLDRLIAIKRELLIEQNRFDSLLSTVLLPHASLLRTHLNTAVHNFYIDSATSMAWLPELVSRVIDSANASKDNLVLTRLLISKILDDNTAIRNEVIRRLKSDSEALIGEYNLFAGEESKTRLKAHLDRVPDYQRDAVGNDELKKQLGDWADKLEDAVNRVFDANESLFLSSMKLNFIYGDSPARPAAIEQYFGPSKAADYLKSVGQDPHLWRGNQ